MEERKLINKLIFPLSIFVLVLSFIPITMTVLIVGSVLSFIIGVLAIIIYRKSKDNLVFLAVLFSILSLVTDLSLIFFVNKII